MEYYVTLDSILNNLSDHPNQKTIQNHKEPESLEKLLEEKLNSLSDILKQIEQEMQARNDLSKNIIFQIYEHYCLLKSKLLGLSFWELGSNSSVDSRRSALGKQLDALKQEVRKEQIQCWQDVSNLKKEFRNWFKQYRDLMQRVRLVTGHKSDSLIVGQTPRI
ncbi:hypothetical protein MYX82_07915 [Acidobacteria bacterium AH-259-D05]|nr:hypothetical protein [Acidobacteria bacterium AH-259-D05]